jgi:hypothetical protein
MPIEFPDFRSSTPVGGSELPGRFTLANEGPVKSAVQSLGPPPYEPVTPLTQREIAVAPSPETGAIARLRAEKNPPGVSGGD